MLASPYWVISLLCNLYDNGRMQWDWLPCFRLATPLLGNAVIHYYILKRYYNDDRECYLLISVNDDTNCCLMTMLYMLENLAVRHWMDSG